MQIYKTRRAASQAVRQMVGWKVKIIALAEGGYAIQCNGRLYLRTDGYVR